MKKLWVLFFIAVISFAYTKENGSLVASDSTSAIYDPIGKQMIINRVDFKSQTFDLLSFDIEKKLLKKIRSADKENVAPAAYCYNPVYIKEKKQMMVLMVDIIKKGEAPYSIWTFDIEKKSWNEIELEDTPPLTKWMSCAYDSNFKKLFIFGGVNMQRATSDLWTFDIEKKTWEKIELDEVPPPRYYHSTVSDSLNKQLLVFGGYGQGGTLLSDLWKYDIEKKKWTEIKTEETPPGRWSHTAIYDSANKYMITFGGVTMTEMLSDTWIFDIEKNQWKEIETNDSPTGRANHCAVYDSVNKQMLIFGGNGQVGFLSDMWSFDIEKKAWQKLKIKFEKTKNNK